MDARPPKPVPSEGNNYLKTALFLDLVGSTAAQAPGPGHALDSATRGHEYGKSKARFLRRARAFISGYGGFPQAGPADDFCAGFQNPQDAVVCALAMQAAFAKRPVKYGDKEPAENMACRIGLHVEAVPGEIQEYLGAAGNLSSRLPSTISPGRVAASEAVKVLCVNLVGPTFGSRGFKELKGVPGQREVFEVGCEPEALRALTKAIRTRLREQQRAWSGRLHEAVDVLRPWLLGVTRDCEPADLTGVDLGQHQPGDRGLFLADVFVNLRVQGTEGASSRDMPGIEGLEESRIDDSPSNVVQALFQPDQPHQVFVGEPGSGKSTFLQYVTLFLSEKLSGSGAEKSRFRDRPVPPLLARQRLIPVRIALRDFADRKLPDDVGRGTSRHVVTYLQARLGDGGYGVAAEVLHRVLEDGQALVCFDGLDEVPAGQLDEVVRAIVHFTKHAYSRCRVVVTCRIASYERPEFKLSGFPRERRIQSLDREQRNEFIDIWYAELSRARKDHAGRAAECADSLKEAIVEPHLEELASNPFFLSCMVGQHRPERRLPKQSALLMEEIVQGVLSETRKMDRRSRGQPAAGGQHASQLEQLLDEVNVPGRVHGLREKLDELAYKARESRSRQASQEAGEIALDDNWLKVELAKLDREKGSTVWAGKLLEALRHRAGLLQSRDGRKLSFAYRFEEFLAASYLASNDAFEGTEFAERSILLINQQHNYARQVVIWSAGLMAHPPRKQRGPVRDLIERLSGQESTIADLELAAAIARDAQMEEWPENVVRGQLVFNGLRGRLSQVFQLPTISPPSLADRAKLASAFGQLGDTRDGVGVKRRALGAESAHRPYFSWCGPDPGKPLDPFPAGPFSMGGDSDAWGSSPTPFQCQRIQRPYFVAKYPVTVAQYRLFAQARGYENDAFWTSEGLKWRNGDGLKEDWPDWLKKEYRKEAFPLSGPKDYSAGFQTPNHPRVGVSWFEAVAFCRWLNATFQPEELGLPGSEWHVRLPTDAEWERVARWREGSEKRFFPWGDEGSEAELTKRCNWYGAGLGQTCAVGLFSPQGDSVGGVADLAGNVWEWCQSKWVTLDSKQVQTRYNGIVDLDDDGGVDPRVVRGGSWGDYFPQYLRAASRSGGRPASRYSRCGFRVVCVVGSR